MGARAMQASKSLTLRSPASSGLAIPAGDSAATVDLSVLQLRSLTVCEAWEAFPEHLPP